MRRDGGRPERGPHRRTPAAVTAAALLTVLMTAPPACAGTVSSGTPPDAPRGRGEPAPLAVGQPATAAELALGDSIFHGRVSGALCAVCHGQRGGGTARGSRLSDTTWRHVDGSLASIASAVTRGVPGPDSAAVPMLPHGGVRLTDREVRAVAAYVHRLSARP